ncbi:hypothetical protein MOSE0_H04852 [Monosporozyma servazzii]
MVYFYESQPNPYGESYQLIMGKDKFENDALIKWGYQELNYLWFHADKYSSGHVYLKLKANQKSIDEVPDDIINDCLQLCKAESIQGNKLPECTILITPWTNLRKSKFMKPGEVSFKTTKGCMRKKCFARDNKIINRLVKTRVELGTDIPEVEAFLNKARKTKDGKFFINYIQENRERLLLEEKERKQVKKLAKKKKKANEEEDFYNSNDPNSDSN